MKLVEGPFSLAHIIYLLLNIILIILGNVLIKKNNITEKKLDLILKISAGILLFTVSAKMINHVISENLPWYYFLPTSICSSSSFILALAILCLKKDNPVLHYVVYMGLFGGFTSTIYPDYLEKVAFFSISGITSLLHHSIDIWIATVCLFTGYIKPEYKKIKYFFVGYGMVILFGLFQITQLKFANSMNINEGLISSLPFLTSWWMLVIICIPFYILFVFLFKKYQSKYNKKEEANASPSNETI